MTKHTAHTQIIENLRDRVYGVAPEVALHGIADSNVAYAALRDLIVDGTVDVNYSLTPDGRQAKFVTLSYSYRIRSLEATKRRSMLRVVAGTAVDPNTNIEYDLRIVKENSDEWSNEVH